MGSLRLVRDGVLLAEVPVIALGGSVPDVIVDPGDDMDAAFAACPDGGTIWCEPGSYGAWQTPAGSKRVTVACSPLSATFRQIHCGGSNVTFDGLNLDAEGTQTAGAVFETGGFANITFRNGFIGNVHNEKGALAGGDVEPTPLNARFENVDFDNITFDAGVHSEAIYSQCPGLQVVNCRFGPQCGATGAIFVTRGDWWGQKPYRGFTFIGNTFARQQADHGAIIFADPSGTSVVDGAEIRNNVFDVNSQVETAAPKTFINSVEAGNTPPQNLPGIAHE